MRYLTVANWHRFQHYKNRNPPWIKFYGALLEDYSFNLLPDTTKLHLILIWLLASRLENRIPADATWIKQRIGSKQKPDLDLLIESNFLEYDEEDSHPLVQDASDSLATCKQLARPETERETEGEGEKRQSRAESVRPGGRGGIGEEVQEIWERHLEARTRYFEHKNGRPPHSVPDLTPELRRLIRESLSRHGLEKTRAAGVGIFYSPHHTGKNETETEYLDPAICWRIKKGQNNVERFAALTAESNVLRNA